jgi:hypothetical protein
LSCIAFLDEAITESTNSVLESHSKDTLFLPTASKTTNY